MNNTIKLAISNTAITIANPRSDIVANALIGKDQSQGLLFLRYVLTLCPIAQMAALNASFEVLQMTMPHQNWSNMGDRYYSNLLKLSQLEAILETVRFFTLDFKTLLPLKEVPLNILREIAYWREALLNMTEKTSCVDELATAEERFRTFLKSWYQQFKHNIKLIEGAYRQFDDLTSLSSQLLLKPNRIKSSDFLNYFIDRVRQDKKFCLSPKDSQSKVVGALARSSSYEKLTFALKDLIAHRVQELIKFMDGGAFDLQIGLYRLSETRSMCHIETARGVLFHLYEISDEKINSAAIVAPTEWSFQNSGALFFWLNQYHQHSHDIPVDLKKRNLRLIANAFDACTNIAIVERD